MKILVAIDLSEKSGIILEYAKKIAIKLNAAIWLVHVVDPDPEFIGYEVGPQVERDAIAERYRDKHRQLQELGNNLRIDGLDVTALLLQGVISNTILNQVEVLDIDFCVIGTHGHGALYDMVVGSVSEDVIRSTKCPIYLVPIK
ncbi:MAG: universal stress protein [Gammaproteobacteria bacterium]|nr:universal stress protein [Gammaproteobacteria bacterium]